MEAGLLVGETRFMDDDPGFGLASLQGRHDLVEGQHQQVLVACVEKLQQQVGCRQLAGDRNTFATQRRHSGCCG